MYAVTEFEKRQCAIVPLSWLVEDQKKCFWPTVYKEGTFLSYVEKQVAPKSSWPKYTVVKVLHLTDNYEAAGIYLQQFIMEESSSEDKAGVLSSTAYSFKDVNVAAITRRDEIVCDNALTLPPTKKRAEDSHTYSISQRHSSGSSEEFSSDSEPEATSRQSQSQPDSVSTLASTITLSTSTNTSASKDDASSKTSVALSSNDVFLSKLEQLIAVQGQHSIMLQNILRTQKAQGVPDCPKGYPQVPVATKADYRLLEDFLNNEENFNYMKMRLASIGGTNVRNCVMNMLKYLLSNKVAMKFNWAGREKRPFKGTNTMKVINEAMRYGHKDATDNVIKQAVQDWLKLSKNRYFAKSRKNEEKHLTK